MLVPTGCPKAILTDPHTVSTLFLHKQDTYSYYTPNFHLVCYHPFFALNRITGLHFSAFSHSEREA